MKFTSIFFKASAENPRAKPKKNKCQQTDVVNYIQKSYLRITKITEVRMKRYLHTTITAIVTATILTSGYLLLSNEATGEGNMPVSQIPYCVVSPAIPTSIDFAGENITLTSHDRRERIDREILAFTYSHTNTLLQIKRANRLFPIVEPILKECGVPDDFKYLMIIESNGDIHAQSPAGAAGLWQFMEKTGKEFGLEVNSYVDERYHIEKATRAACGYLKKSYDKFGNWMSVAASYNAGMANISRRAERQKEDNAINMSLPAETSRYIFRLLAAKTIFSNPSSYGFILKKQDLYPMLPVKETLTIKNSIASWADIAKKHSLTYIQLREANPWIRGSNLPNEHKKSYTVIIPDCEGLHYNPKETKAHSYKWVLR